MNLFKNTFKFYDSVATDFDNDDLEFYESFVQSKNSKILEIGCGTGRVSIWLATRGYSVIGLDLSKYMLSVFNKKLERNKYLQSKIKIVHADMSDFWIDKSFDLIIAPSKSFQAITDIKKAKLTLICIKKHMLKGSLLILDLFDPKMLLEQNNLIGKEVTVFKSENLKVLYKCIAVDNANYTIYSKKTIKETVRGVDNEYVDYQELRFYTEEQISELLLEIGFEVVNIYSKYNQFHSKDGIIISARLAKGAQ